MNKLETVIEEAREHVLALAERLKTETEAEPKEGPNRKAIGNLEKAIEKYLANIAKMRSQKTADGYA